MKRTNAWREALSVRSEKIKRILILLSVLTYAAFIASSAKAHAEKRQVAASDLFSLREPSDVRLSPTGNTLSFVLRFTDSASNREASSISTIATRGGSAKRVTDCTCIDSSPRWSPGGRY